MNLATTGLGGMAIGFVIWVAICMSIHWTVNPPEFVNRLRWRFSRRYRKTLIINRLTERT